MSGSAQLQGTLFVSGKRALYLYVGPIVATAQHAHHAMQIVLAPQGLDLHDEAERMICARAAVIPPRVAHRHGACAHGALLFVDGDDLASRELSRNAARSAAAWARAPLEVSLPMQPTREDARSLLASILSSIGLGRGPEPRHPAARRMCQFLEQNGDTDLAQLSREAGLSPRQMRHAFARDIGLSMRACVRWKRLGSAIAAVEKGATLTDAAACAGFADSAHLSRVFREQFGMTPTQGLSAISWHTLD